MLGDTTNVKVKPVTTASLAELASRVDEMRKTYYHIHCRQFVNEVGIAVTCGLVQAYLGAFFSRSRLPSFEYLSDLQVPAENQMRLYKLEAAQARSAAVDKKAPNPAAAKADEWATLY
jgi:hypothetical protein